MSLEQFKVENFRNIERAELFPSTHLNLVTGPNAAGKTSLLESIDCLSRGRSFRSRKTISLLKSGTTLMRITARVCKHDEQSIRIGMEKSLQTTRLRVRASPVQSMSKITAELPVQVIHPQSHELIQGSPQQRRAFLDWGVFHVEQRFIKVWQRYVRALKQRNAALRSDLPDQAAMAWHDEMLESANMLDQFRKNYVESLTPRFDAYISSLLDGLKINLGYQRGWDNRIDLTTALDNSLSEDRQRKFTHSGPHRADLRITMGGRVASEVASRGQQKLIAAALKLAQTHLLIERSRDRCVLLVDDLPSELDVMHKKLLFNAIAHLDVQVFISSLDQDEIDHQRWSHQKVFHVKHGKISELI